jgi:hypothetical protein
MKNEKMVIINLKGTYITKIFISGKYGVCYFIQSDII